MPRSQKQNIPLLGHRVDVSFLATLLGITRQHATRLCRGGKIPGVYTSKGGHWRARWSAELSDWIRINRRTEKLSSSMASDEMLRLYQWLEVEVVVPPALTVASAGKFIHLAMRADSLLKERKRIISKQLKKLSAVMHLAVAAAPKT